MASRPEVGLAPARSGRRARCTTGRQVWRHRWRHLRHPPTRRAHPHRAPRELSAPAKPRRGKGQRHHAPASPGADGAGQRYPCVRSRCGRCRLDALARAREHARARRRGRRLEDRRGARREAVRRWNHRAGCQPLSRRAHRDARSRSQGLPLDDGACRGGNRRASDAARITRRQDLPAHANTRCVGRCLEGWSASLPL